MEQKHWFERKFVNPRTAEGEPQTERLQYARELFESFGQRDKRFSGAAIVGSTMKGYGVDESSDIDVVLFFKETPVPHKMPETEFLGIKSPARWVSMHTFNADFNKFKEEFDSKRVKDKKRTFKIDLDTGEFDINNSFKITILRNLKMPTPGKDDSHIFYSLSYPTISTKNPKALVSIDKVILAMRTAVKKSSEKEREELLDDILKKTNELFGSEYEQHLERSKDKVSYSKEDYVTARMEMLKRQLKKKFGLEPQSQ